VCLPRMGRQVSEYLRQSFFAHVEREADDHRLHQIKAPGYEIPVKQGRDTRSVLDVLHLGQVRVGDVEGF